MKGVYLCGKIMATWTHGMMVGSTALPDPLDECGFGVYQKLVALDIPSHPIKGIKLLVKMEKKKRKKNEFCSTIHMIGSNHMAKNVK